MLFISDFYCVSQVCLKFNLSCQHLETDDFYRQRQEMVDEQIIARGICNRHVIKAMQKVERHLFMPEDIRYMAYSDCPISIGYEQTISQPYIVAYMTDSLNLIPTDRVLEIGTGSDYQAAVLAEICDLVYSVEIIPEVAHKAMSLFNELKYRI
jgi:protein-L-isoaspartate(D-aspartate) O-methyltransferase